MWAIKKKKARREERGETKEKEEEYVLKMGVTLS